MNQPQHDTETEGKRGEQLSEHLSGNMEPSIIVRLTPKWKPRREEVERGYFRAGSGWYEGITDTELMDSVRAWWRVAPNTIERRGIRHVIAYAARLTRAVYELDSVIGPRESDGRHAFRLSPIESGPVFDLAVGLNGKSIDFPRGSSNPIRYLG